MHSQAAVVWSQLGSSILFCHSAQVLNKKCKSDNNKKKIKNQRAKEGNIAAS